MYNLGVPNANPCSNFDVKPGLSIEKLIIPKSQLKLIRPKLTIGICTVLAKCGKCM